MRVLNLNANLDLGEGSVGITAEYKRCGALLRADILKDWIYDLERLYEEAITDMRERGATSLVKE
jgi:hypothetical protein